MQTYKDLRIEYGPGEVEGLILRIDQSLSNGWRRGREMEARAHQGAANPLLCYACDEAIGRPAAALWLADHDDGSLWVSNIVPLHQHQLSYSEYNAILDEFTDSFVIPAATALGWTVSRSTGDVELGDGLSPEAVAVLRSFSAAANKTTGSGHPRDRERWLRFLVLAFHSPRTPSGDLLYRWFTEVEDWPEDIARGLQFEYDFALDVLDAGLGRD